MTVRSFFYVFCFVSAIPSFALGMQKNQDFDLDQNLAEFFRPHEESVDYAESFLAKFSTNKSYEEILPISDLHDLAIGFKTLCGLSDKEVASGLAKYLITKTQELYKRKPEVKRLVQDYYSNLKPEQKALFQEWLNKVSQENRKGIKENVAVGAFSLWLAMAAFIVVNSGIQLFENPELIDRIHGFGDLALLAFLGNHTAPF